MAAPGPPARLLVVVVAFDARRWRHSDVIADRHRVVRPVQLVWSVPDDIDHPVLKQDGLEQADDQDAIVEQVGDQGRSIV